MEEILVENLNPEQLKAVTHIEGPLLVVAGAGSGKTRVITYRIAYLINQGVLDDNILGVTFTNKAADEMRERVSSLLRRPLPPPLLRTFHSFGARILRNEIHHLGYSDRFVIYDETDSLRAIKEAMESLKLKDEALSPKEVQWAITRQKNEAGLDRSLPLEELPFLKQVRAISEAYHAILKQNNAVDFDDLIVLPLRLFEEYPGILKRYQNQYRYVLVDEYQDTNAPQYRLVKMLCHEHKNICVVGDPDQSIYRWRGSDIRNILNFQEDFPTARKIVLEQNYRSTTLILDAANCLIRYNSQRTTKNLWSRLGQGENLRAYYADDDREEAAIVCDIVEDFLLSRKLRYRDIAVFYRTHAQSRLIEESFRAADIPYAVVGGPGFYERKEVKDILAYLRVIATPGDSISLLRIINVPRRGIGKLTLDKLAAASRRKGLPVYEVAKEADSLAEISPSARKALTSFVEMIEKLREKGRSTTPRKITEQLITRIGYRDMLKKDFPQDADDRIDNLRELMDSMDSFLADNPSSGLDDFLERTSLVSEIDTWQDDEEKVTLMTVHNSKGLEFKAVIMVGLEEGMFPHINSVDDPEKLEEERRLCYVGVTRAKRYLFLLAAGRRRRHGRYVQNRESRFLAEMLAEDDPPGEGETSYYVEQQEELPAGERPATSFQPGDRVVHPSFGQGTVLGVQEGFSDLFLRVLFDRGGEKLLSPSLAQLRKI